MISGGDFWLGRLREDEIHGEAFEDLRRVFLSWDRPRPKWPAGTTFTEPRKEGHWSSLTSWAITPSGVRYELLLERREEEPDPREEPPVIWSVMVDRCEVFAFPRIAQMKVTIAPPHQVDRDREADAYAGVPIGLARRYAVGRLRRGLIETTRTVSEGWGYG